MTLSLMEVLLFILILLLSLFLHKTLLFLLFLTSFGWGGTFNSEFTTLELSVVLSLNCFLHFLRGAELDVSNTLANKGIFISDDSDIQDFAYVLEMLSKLLLINDPWKIPNENSGLEIVLFSFLLPIKVHSDMLITYNYLIKLLSCFLSLFLGLIEHIGVLIVLLLTVLLLYNLGFLREFSFMFKSDRPEPDLFYLTMLFEELLNVFTGGVQGHITHENSSFSSFLLFSLD